MTSQEVKIGLRGRTPGKQAGVALVLVLWMLALLTIMVMGYSATMHTDTLLTAHAVQSARARALSQAGVWVGVWELLRPKSEQTWQPNGTPYPVQFGNGRITVRLYDEAGKIDLNTARPALLHALLNAAGLKEDQAQHILQAIQDWRDRDSLTRQYGAEDEDYARAGYNHGAKDGPFNSVGELREVMGMTETVFEKIAPALTVYSHQPAINPATAPRVVLQALPGADRASIDNYMASRQAGEATAPILTGIDHSYLTGTGGRTFTVTSTGEAADSQFTTSAVVLLKPNAPVPYSVLSWTEGVTSSVTGDKKE